MRCIRPKDSLNKFAPAQEIKATFLDHNPLADDDEATAVVNEMSGARELLIKSVGHPVTRTLHFSSRSAMTKAEPSSPDDGGRLSVAYDMHDEQNTSPASRP